jgi:DHA2 family methylenomycin A resistance protein-like MFS transporter
MSLTKTQPAARTTQTRRWLALTTLCLAVLIAQVDTSVVNLATRPIGTYFGASVTALQWVVDGYNLTYAVLLLTGGLLADLFGRRRVFMIGVAVFTAASLLCALAPNVPLLIAGRAIAGLGAALLLPASLAIIRVLWTDPAERGHALGIWAACNGLSLAIGATLGGFFIGWFGWRSIFVMVLPLGLAAFTLAVPSIPESSDPRGRDFDAAAQILGALALGGLALAGIEAHHQYLLALGALAVAAIALALFCRAELHRGATALVPLDMFHIRPFRGAIIATVGMTFGVYGVLFLVPLAWQSTGTMTASGVGVALLPMALLFVLVSPASARLSQRVGVRAITSGGVATIGLGLYVLAATAGWQSIVMAEIGLALTGLGMGLATGPLLGVAVSAVASARSGTAAALINVARMVGATLGVAVLGSIYAGMAGGFRGLCFAMLAGGSMQLACAAVAWVEAKPAAN